MTELAPQRETAAQSYRRRVLVAVPPGGFGPHLAAMRAWLDKNCGRMGWASAPAGFDGVGNDAVAFYFADEADAGAFVDRFCCGYRTPVAMTAPR
ncbi:MAG TPA: hypothetical protein VGS13_06175 [Stellaceae bacterium]|nr:hypothetical protein [Stellaceae bacterium]